MNAYVNTSPPPPPPQKKKKDAFGSSVRGAFHLLIACALDKDAVRIAKAVRGEGAASPQTTIRGTRLEMPVIIS